MGRGTWGVGGGGRNRPVWQYADQNKAAPKELASRHATRKLLREIHSGSVGFKCVGTLAVNRS